MSEQASPNDNGFETRIDRCFSRLRERGEKAFVAFVTAGDPSMRATVDIVRRLEDVGADLVELGIPFSDPLADGRINQQAATRALAKGATVYGVLRCVEAIRRHSEIPLLFFSYVNPLLAHGFGRIAGEAADAGVDGFVVLDLPVEESAPYAKLMHEAGLNNVQLVTPTSPPERIRRIVRIASGFVYCVSREGVTGKQKSLSEAAIALVERTRKATTLPTAIGFGISTPDHARAAASVADGIVVGSAIVERFHQEPHTSEGRQAAAAWVGKLVKAVKEIRS